MIKEEEDDPRMPAILSEEYDVWATWLGETGNDPVAAKSLLKTVEGVTVADVPGTEGTEAAQALERRSPPRRIWGGRSDRRRCDGSRNGRNCLGGRLLLWRLAAMEPLRVVRSRPLNDVLNCLVQPVGPATEFTRHLVGFGRSP